MRIFFISCLLFLFAFSASAANISYEVEVKTPTRETTKILEEYLDLITQRTLDDLDEDQLEVLVEDTPSQAEKYLQTLGYFNSKTEVKKEGNKYIVDVTLGDPVKIKNVDVIIDGQMLEDEDLPKRYLGVMEGWSLPIGDVFTQSDWGSSKEKALRSVTAEHYPLAKMTESRAEIDPSENSAALTVKIDSNRFVRFGEITIIGAKRYPETVAKNLANFTQGTPYTLAKLLEYQTAIEEDGHYSNATVAPRFDKMPADKNEVPLYVTIEEVLRKKLEAGLRYDSEEGFGVTGGYTHYNVFNRGYTGSTSAKFGDYEQSYKVGLMSPRDQKGYFYSGNFGFENTEWQKLRTKSINSTLWRIKKRGDIESKMGIEFLKENSRLTTENGENFGTSQALLFRFGWLQRKVDTEMRPRNGYLVDVNLGITPGSFASSTAFLTSEARAVYYYTPKNQKYGTLVAHAEVGHISAKDNDKVPKVMLFRTGGATTVRGYEYQSIGIDLPDDAVIGGTSMAMFSLEYQFPITQDFSLAVFHDEGAVSNKFNKLKFNGSNGIGVRWFSPLAPLSLDVAHADKDSKIRWHLSIGFVF